MSPLCDNVAVMAVALVAGAFAWLYGGMVGGALVPVLPWLFAFLFEAMLFFPQRRRGESTYEARERCWQALKSDPLTWVTLAFFVLLAIPFVNTGLCPSCDYPLIMGGADAAPPVPFLPYCVRRMQHFNVVVWFVPSLTAMLAVRHALLKRGKRRLLEWLVWNGLALGILGMVQQVTGARAPLWADYDGRSVYFFSTFGYPNMGGDYFTTLFGIGVALWCWKQDAERRAAERRLADGAAAEPRYRLFWRRHLVLAPAIVCFVSAVMTLSRAAIFLAGVLAALFVLHIAASRFVRLSRAGRVKAVAGGGLAILVFVLAAVTVVPSAVRREVGTVDTRETLNRLTGKGQYHSRVATEIWLDNFLFGCGGWGYKHFSLEKMTESELRGFWPGGAANVHNDSLQFLCEHGLVGFGCLAAAVVLLLWPVARVWKRLAGALRFARPKEPLPKPTALFAFPAPALFVLLTALSTFVHSFCDCPLRSPAVLSLFFISLAAVDGFLPRMRRL